MAEHLASIFGTEKDRVNCPFYFKIGACRHGDRCSRLHNKPSISPTLLLCNMYQRPDMITPGVDAQGNPIDPERIQEDFEDYDEDNFEELSKHGEIESLHICCALARPLPWTLRARATGRAPGGDAPPPVQGPWPRPVQPTAGASSERERERIGAREIGGSREGDKAGVPCTRLIG